MRGFGVGGSGFGVSAAGMNSKGIPTTSAYSAVSRLRPSGSAGWKLSYAMRRRARPVTCSHNNWVLNARNPTMWVTVRASHPSVSMLTDTTQRTCAPSRSCFPTVFSMVRTAASASFWVVPAAAATRRFNAGGIVSSCPNLEWTIRVRGDAYQRPFPSTFDNSPNAPILGVPSGFSPPAM